MRLIDADELKEVIHDHDYRLADVTNSIDYGMFTIGIDQAIDECHAVDAVEVVRCRDCKRWTPGEITEYDDFEPPKCALYGPMHADDYCSYGKRREDGDT